MIAPRSAPRAMLGVLLIGTSCAAFRSADPAPAEAGPDASDVTDAGDATARDGTPDAPSDPCALDSGTVLCTTFENGTCAPFAPQQATTATVTAVPGDAHGGSFYCRFCPDRSRMTSLMIGQARADAGRFSLTYWTRRAVEGGAPASVWGSLDLLGGANQFVSAPLTGAWKFESQSITVGFPVLELQLGVSESLVSRDAGAPPDGCIDFDDIVLAPAP